MKKWSFACLKLIILVFVPSSYGREPAGLNVEAFDFTNRRLSGVISLYQRAGFDVVYSSALVTNQMIVFRNPPAMGAKERLNAMLGDFDLVISEDTQYGWRVIKSTRPRIWIDIQVVNEKTSAPIEGVRASYTEGGDVPVSENSYLNVPLADHDYIVSVSAPGYETAVFPASSLRGKNKIELVSTDIRIEEVLVVGNVFQRGKQEFSAAQKTAIEIDNMPKRGGDPLQVLNSIPGISTVGVSSQPSVQGGLGDETGYYFDGVELLEPFHLKDFYSLISGISSETVANIDVYTGSYPSKYGNKLSGIVEITPYDPLSENTASIGANFFNSSVTVNRSSESGRARWLMSARRGNLNEVLSEVNDEIGAPKFYDLYNKVSLELDRRRILEFANLYIHDNIALQSLDEGEGESATSDYRSSYLWSRISTNDPTYSDSLTATFVDIDNFRQGFINEPDNPDESVGELLDNRDFQIYRLEYDVSQTINKQNLLMYGGRIEHFKSSYAYTSSAELGALSSYFSGERTLEKSTVAELDGVNASIYLSHRFGSVTDYLLEWGLRGDYQEGHSASQHQISPRIAYKQKTPLGFIIKANAGRYYQNASVTELEVEYGKSEYYEAIKSNKLSLGVQIDQISNFEIDVDVYYKKIENPRPYFENMFNSYGLLPEIAPDRVSVKPSDALAQGLDAFVYYTISESANFWLGYSYIKAHDTVDGKNIARRWAQRHTLKSGLNFTKGNFSLSNQFLWHSGWRATRTPQELSGEYQILDRNNSTLPKFFSFDIKASYRRYSPSFDYEIYLEVINTFNYDNVGSLEVELEENDSGFSVIQEQESLFPVIPNIGFFLRF